MARCVKCGRGGLFFKVSAAGLCPSCQDAADRKQRFEEAAKQRSLFLQGKRAAFTSELVSIPLADVGRDGPKVNVRPLEGFYDLKYSNITARSQRETLGGFVAIDLETTGLKATDSILELSAIRFSDFAPEAIFTTFVRPSGSIPAEASKVNGITAEMVSDAPRFWEILPSLQSFIGSSAIVGHNLPFDLKFLYRRGFNIQPKQRLYDTLEISQRLLKKPNSAGTNDWDVQDHKLSTVCEYYGIYIDSAHRSAADALAAGKLFCRLVEERTSL